MESRPQASASIVAAGVVAIFGGVLSAISIGFVLAMTSLKVPQPGPVLPPALRPVLYGMWIFFLLCALFVVVAGVQLIRLRNWARLALLVIAGCMLFFGVVGIAVIVVTLFGTPPDPVVSKAILAAILAFVYGIPIVVALWWLILLTRRSITQQFLVAATAGNASPSSFSWLNNPQVPLAIRIVGWYLASFVLFLPFLPFLPAGLPALYFGRVFRGPSAIAVYIFSFALLAVAGIGLLLVKRWSYPLTMASQILVCLNGIVTAFMPSLEANMVSIMKEMGLPTPLPPSTEAMLHQMRFTFLSGLVIPLAVIVVLLVYRRSFFGASHESPSL